MGDVIGAAPSQATRNVLADAAQIEAYNTAQILGHLPDERGARGPVEIVFQECPPVRATSSGGQCPGYTPPAYAFFSQHCASCL